MESVAQYAKLTNVHSPADTIFSVSGLRMFGSGQGTAPARVTGIKAQRQTNRRLINVSWKANPSADFYIVRYGDKADCLYLNYPVYGKNEVAILGLNANVDYFFTVDAVNDSGVAKGT